MSTNYYFINRKTREESQNKNEKVDEIFRKATYALDELDCEEAGWILEEVKWRFEEKEESVHIGKRSMGWVPLFEAGEYFSTMKELEEWHLKNQNEYIIENEYGEELDWNNLETELFEWEGKKTHSSNSYIEYYKDEDGYEWTRGEFS